MSTPSLLLESTSFITGGFQELKRASSYHMITALISSSVQEQIWFCQNKVVFKSKNEDCQTNMNNEHEVFFSILNGFPPPVYLPLNSISLKVNHLTNCINQESCKTVLRWLRIFIYSFNLPNPNRISFQFQQRPVIRSCKRLLSILSFWQESSSWGKKPTGFCGEKKNKCKTSDHSFTFLGVPLLFVIFKCSGQGDILAKSNAK